MAIYSSMENKKLSHWVLISVVSMFFCLLIYTLTGEPLLVPDVRGPPSPSLGLEPAGLPSFPIPLVLRPVLDFGSVSLVLRSVRLYDVRPCCGLRHPDVISWR